MTEDIGSQPLGGDKEHRTVSRIALILEAAALSKNGVRLSAIADDLGAPKSSVHGLLKGLVAVGYLTEQDGSYIIGPAVQVLVHASKQVSLAERARAEMSRLHKQFDETVMIGTRAGNSIVYFAWIESNQLIKYSPPLNKRRPLFPTSMGKIYLAELTRQQAERHLAKQVRDPKKRASYLNELDEVKRTGIAFNHSETVPGVFGAAAGIRQMGRLVGCISVAGPIERLQPKEQEIGRAVRAAAHRVSAQLG